MPTILPLAQALVQKLTTLMPTPYQQDSLQALLGLFLAATGSPLPQYCQTKSASALSRFLNQYQWSTRKVIKAVRSKALQQILSQPTKGRRPTLQVIIDLTTLEKRGNFKAFDRGVRVYHSKRGLHLVVMYLVVGQWQIPWNFRVYRGKDTPSPAHLGLRLLQSLPKVLTQHFQVLVLADSAFGSVEFLQGVRKLKYHAITGLRCDRRLEDGRSVAQLHKRGQQVRLLGLKSRVHLSWYYFKREDGKREKRYVLSTKVLKGSTITWWGRRRWQIEGFFKTAKYRFGLACFGQQTLLGVYRWLILSLTAYLLAHWSYLHSPNRPFLDWGEAAQSALKLLFPLMALFPLLVEIQRLQPLAKHHGLNINVTWSKI